MKKLAFLCVLFFAASCTIEKPTEATSADADQNPTSTAIDGKNGFELLTSADAAVDFENLRFYPIVANAAHIAAHESLATVKNLKEAMQIQGFRITEKKPYGRRQDAEAVNRLTVQNKTNETIYLMAGDVIQGGNQDRVLAQDMMLPPRTLRDIHVFCVEQNRWEYRGTAPDQEENELDKKNRKVFAFTGYYNVVSNDIRKTVKQERDQQLVWEGVNQMTKFNNASTATGTYAALEDSPEFTKERDRYLKFFENKFDQENEMIGVVAVSGDKILGTDIFNHPQLFQKQFKVLLHAYITEAISNGEEGEISEKQMENYADKMNRNYSRTLSHDKEKETKFRYNGKIVHFSDL